MFTAKRSHNAFKPSMALLLLSAIGAAPLRADDQEKIQGTWHATHAQIGTNVANAKQLKQIEVMIDGDKLTLVEPAKKYVVHFTLKPDAKDGDVDFYKDAGKKERIWHGIYAFDGKELKLCWAPAAHERPTKFGSNKHNDDRYFVVKKK